MPTSPGQRAADCQPRGRSARLSPQQVVNGLLGAGAAVLGLIVVGQVVQSMIWHIRFPYEIKGWAEGHFLYNAVQLSRGENIYVDPAKHPMTVMPYGFLYPLLMAPLVGLFGPCMWIGRTLSALSAGVSLAWVYLTATRRARSPLAGVCGVVLVCGTYHLTGTSWDWGHSDSLYLALGLASLMCVERLPPGRVSWRVLPIVVLSCASCCAKQTGGGFILAAGTALLIRRRRLGLIHLCACSLSMGGVWAAGHFLTDGQFERYMILPLGEPYLPSKIVPLVKLLVLNAPVLLAAAVWQIKRDLRLSRWADPVAWGLFWVGLPSLGAYIKVGGVLNSLMPLFFLLSVPAGVRLCRMISSGPSARGYRLAAMIGLLGQLLLVRFVIDPSATWSHEQLVPWYVRAGRLIEEELRDPNERVLMGDRVSFAVRSGHRVYDAIPMATYGRDAVLEQSGRSAAYPEVQVRLRTQIQDRLKEQIESQVFDKILIPQDEIDGLRRDVVESLSRKYRVARVIQPEVRLPAYTPMLVFKPIRSATRPVSMPSRQHGADIPGLNRSPFLSIGTACCSHPKPRPASSDSWTVRGPTW